MYQNPEPELLAELLTLLKKHNGRKVCADTGVSYNTLQAIRQGKSKEPSVNTVEKLLNYLRAKEQEAAA